MNTSTIQRTISNLCVFCGSSAGNDTAYTDAACALAGEMAARSIHLVYGGGGAGIMGTLASALRDTGVRVTGIIPERLYEMVKHLDHSEDELVVVHTMHERKAAMYDRSDAFVALPGGIGTLEELMEALTWLDRKSTRLNSSHVRISYAVFCLKKKNNTCKVFASRDICVL